MADGRREIFWIPKAERMPTAADADSHGCVLVYDRYNGVMVTGYNNKYGVNRFPITHWATPPVKPGDIPPEVG